MICAELLTFFHKSFASGQDVDNLPLEHSLFIVFLLIILLVFLLAFLFQNK